MLVTIAASALLVPLIKLVGAIRADTIYQEARHQRPMVEYHQQQLKGKPGELYYFGRRRRSAEFYSAGTVQYLPDPNRLAERVNQADPFYLAVHHRAKLVLDARCEQQHALNSYELYYCR